MSTIHVPSDLRDANLRRALTMLHRADGEVTRVRLARELDLSRATVATVVSTLSENGLTVEEPASPQTQRGRPTTRIVPSRQGPIAVVVEVQNKFITISDFGLSGTILAEEIKTFTGNAQETLVHITNKLKTRTKDLGSRCIGVGISFARADVQLAETLPIIQEELNVGILADRDTTFAAMVEVTRGSARDASSILYVSVDKSVEGSLLVNGQAFQGKHSSALEIGHLPIGNNSRKCTCGNKGCWETEINLFAFAKAAGKKANGENIYKIAEAIFQKAEQGDVWAKQAVVEIARSIGHGLGKLINTFDPEVIALNPWAHRFQQAEAVAFSKSLRKSVMPIFQDDLPLVFSSSIKRPSLRGAADAVFNKWLNSDGFNLSRYAEKLHLWTQAKGLEKAPSKSNSLFIGTGNVVIDHFVYCDELPIGDDFPIPGTKMEAESAEHMRVIRKEWVDQTGAETQVGGPVVVALRQAKQLGASVDIKVAVGDDEVGLYTLKTLIQQGFGANSIVVQKGRRSFSVIVWIDRNGERSMLLDSGTLDPLGSKDVESLLTTKPNVVYVDTWQPQAARLLAQHGHKNGARIHYDVDPWRSWSPDLLALSDIAQVSYKEVMQWGSMRDAAINLQSQFDLELAIVTNGEFGLYAVEKDGKEYDINSYEVETINSVGAGDVFGGCFEMAMLKNTSIADSLRFGAAGAAALVRGKGNSTLPTTREIDQIFKTEQI